jgi:hypothetical protein
MEKLNQINMEDIQKMISGKQKEKQSLQIEYNQINEEIKRKNQENNIVFKNEIIEINQLKERNTKSVSSLISEIDSIHILYGLTLFTTACYHIFKK